MNAIYRCFNEAGRCFEFRADSEDSCRNLLYIARSCFPDSGIVDLCDPESGGEICAETENEDDFPESEFLKVGEDFKEIPLIIPPKKGFDSRTLKRLVDALAERPESEVEVLEDEVVELPLVVPTKEEVEAHEVELEKEREEEVRPLVVIEVIMAREESRDLAGTFD